MLKYLQSEKGGKLSMTSHASKAGKANLKRKPQAKIRHSEHASCFIIDYKT